MRAVLTPASFTWPQIRNARDPVELAEMADGRPQTAQVQDRFHDSKLCCAQEDGRATKPHLDANLRASSKPFNAEERVRLKFVSFKRARSNVGFGTSAL